MLGVSLSDPIGTLVGDPVATITPTATLREAAHALAADGSGCSSSWTPAGCAGCSPSVMW
jgi:hypothetical protein